MIKPPQHSRSRPPWLRAAALPVLLLLLLIPGWLFLRQTGTAAGRGLSAQTNASSNHAQAPRVPADESAAAHEARSLGLERIGQFPVSRADLVTAMPSSLWHQDIVHGSRGWREGIRSVIASNGEPSKEQKAAFVQHNETWVFYPDDKPYRSFHKGDSRAALVPFLAHKELGDSYKWLLYGDDDTQFFVDGVLRLVQDFDPEVPWFITDNVWWSIGEGPPVTDHRWRHHPTKLGPVCIPCHYNASHWGDWRQTDAAYEPIRGCPCTPEVLCAHRHHADVLEEQWFNEHCDMPRIPYHMYSLHGGAGALMSIGLMRTIKWEEFEACVLGLRSTGGDAFLSICLWQFGHAITTPGPAYFRHSLRGFDGANEDRMGLSDMIMRGIEGTCRQPDCEERLQHLVSLHVRGVTIRSPLDAGYFMRALSWQYDAWAEARYARQVRDHWTAQNDKALSFEERTAQQADAAEHAAAVANADWQAEMQVYDMEAERNKGKEAAQAAGGSSG